MITLAFDTATDRCTVAVSDGARVAHRYADGARRHAGVILGLMSDALDECDASPIEIERIIMADGPGSFTGLRVGASVAKALTWRTRVEWWTAPSLLARAVAVASPAGAVVMAVSDALRGELYAGCWRVAPDRVERIGEAPHAMAPASLAAFGPVDLLTGAIPEALLADVRAATGGDPIVDERARADARVLLALVGRAGALSRVESPELWEPVYGRPAEAQAVWERKHGIALPAATSIAR